MDAGWSEHSMHMCAERTIQNVSDWACSKRRLETGFGYKIQDYISSVGAAYT